MPNLPGWLSRGGAKQSKESPRLIIGIGNPGPKYAETRHNVGFMAVDLLSERHGIRVNDKRKDAELGQGAIAGRSVVLVKPRTFVNNTGVAARYLLTRFGTKPPEMLIVLDDLDLPVGKMRMRKSGGSGGHNGLNSVNRELNTQDYPRLRIGIGRPAHDAIQHVLGGFTKDEQAILNETLERAVEAVEAWVEHGTDYAMNHYN